MKRICVCIDMQQDFITGSLANPAAEAILPKVVEFIKNFDGDVIFTRDTHQKDFLETNEGHYLPVEHCIEDTEGWQIHPSLLQFADVTNIIDKPTFGSVDLMAEISYIYTAYTLEKYPTGEWFKIAELERQKIDNGKELEIHILGTVSSICVVSNVLMIKADYPEAKVIVHKNLCADLDDEGQEAAMLVMQRCQCEIVED